jgi:hypothetical protein
MMILKEENHHGKHGKHGKKQRTRMNPFQRS